MESGFGPVAIVNRLGQRIADVYGGENDIDNGKLISRADELLETSTKLLRELKKLNIETEASVRLQELMLEIDAEHIV
jgi:hypothetical protein